MMVGPRHTDASGFDRLKGPAEAATDGEVQQRLSTCRSGRARPDEAFGLEGIHRRARSGTSREARVTTVETSSGSAKPNGDTAGQIIHTLRISAWGTRDRDVLQADGDHPPQAGSGGGLREENTAP